MKRFIAALLIMLLLPVAASCGARSDTEKTARAFFDALRIYDRAGMEACMTAFPDNSGYVYLDDIFNDAEYVQLYRLLYGSITWKTVSAEKKALTVSCEIPDIQSLYAHTMTAVLTLAVEDASLQAKLEEDERNGILLIQQAMLSFAEDPANIKYVTEEFTLSFQDGKIVCDDAARTLITGKLFLSKNTKAD